MPFLAILTVQLAFIDASWAIPCNTLLIVILALVNRGHAKRIDRTESQARRAVGVATAAIKVVDRRKGAVPPVDSPQRRTTDHAEAIAEDVAQIAEDVATIRKDGSL